MSPLAAALVVYFRTSVPCCACGGGLGLLLILCPWACGTCFLWRWCALRWRVAPFSRLRAGVPHAILLSVWTAQKAYVGGRAAAWCSWRLFFRWRARWCVVVRLCPFRRWPPWLYLVALAAVHTMCVHGHTSWPLGARGRSCVWFVVWCAFCDFPCCALCFGTLVPLLLSHTLLVSWRPRPMRAGDVRVCSLGDGGAVVVLFPSCVARHGSLSTLGSVANVEHTCFGGRHFLVASNPCCLVVLLFFSVLGRAQVPSSYCMHFTKCFGARNVQLCCLGGSCVRGFLGVSYDF